MTETFSFSSVFSSSHTLLRKCRCYCAIAQYGEEDLKMKEGRKWRMQPTHKQTTALFLSLLSLLSFRSVTALRLLMMALLTASRHTRETQAARDNACGPLSLWAMSVTSSGSEPTVVAAAVATSSPSIALTAVECSAMVRQRAAQSGGEGEEDGEEEVKSTDQQKAKPGCRFNPGC